MKIMQFKIGIAIYIVIVLLLSGCMDTSKDFVPPGPVMETYYVSDDYTLYCSKVDSGIPRYDLVNEETGESTNLPTMPESVILESIVNENFFIFHASGENSESSIKHFPSLLICYRSNDGTFQSVRRELYHNLEDGVSAGSQEGAILEAISFSFDSVQCMFTNETSEQGGTRKDIPPVSTSYDKENSQFNIHISGCVPSSSLVILDDTLNYGAGILGYDIQMGENQIVLKLTLDTSVVTSYRADSTLAKKHFCTFRFS